MWWPLPSSHVRNRAIRTLHTWLHQHMTSVPVTRASSACGARTWGLHPPAPRSRTSFPPRSVVGTPDSMNGRTLTQRRQSPRPRATTDDAAASSSSASPKTSRHTDFSAIPVVNIAPLCDPDSSFESRVAVATQLHEACKDVGFFYIVGHGCPSAVSDGVRDAAREWFARPTEEKNAYKIRPGTEGRGYQGLGANVTRYDGGFARDWHEAIDLYKDFAPDHPDVVAGKPLHVPNPTILDAPELNAAIDAWRDESLRVGAAVLRGIALGLGLDENFFITRGRADDPFWVMRVIHYPPLPSEKEEEKEKKKKKEEEEEEEEEEDEGTGEISLTDDKLDMPDNDSVAAAKEGAHLMKSVPLSCGEHTDYGLLTIVNQDATATALQVQNAAGRWVDAPPLEGSFVCNIGDMLQIWTNGLYQPTVHRVLHTGGADGDGKGKKGVGGQSRISVPFFFEPNFSAVVAPLPQFCGATEGEGESDREGEEATDGTNEIIGAKFEPVVYGDHLTKKVYSNFVEGSV